MELGYAVIDSPVGRLFIGVDDDNQLTRLSFHSSESVLGEMEKKGFSLVSDRARTEPVVRQLEAYFAGDLTEFQIPLKPLGTPFQRDVWQALQKIPFGICKTYGEIANSLGNPGASRAVGLANNRNPIAIVIPCHRVIGNNGHLTGFGGGTDTKRQLLVHEGYFLI